MDEQHGFTLIELSLVLVIIGLIIGGVVAGRELINAATIRAQISQIEKYDTSVRTFQLKYDSLPGDLSPATASAFGFATRSGLPGQGDNNGSITGPDGLSVVGNEIEIGGGEVGLFWNDLSQANMLDGSFTSATATSTPDMTASTVGLYLPQAKLGNSNYVTVLGFTISGIFINTGNSWAIMQITGATAGIATVNTNLFSAVPVIQAYSIDQKMDDGLPRSGHVAGIGLNDDTNPAPTTCVDYNGDVTQSSSSAEYTRSVNAGAGTNCFMFFNFQ